MSDGKRPYEMNEENLKRYLAGKLDGAASHDLEREALHSDFEGDALDGWEAHDLKDLEADMTDIRQRLDRRNSNNSYVWWKFAAVFALLITSIWVVWNITGTENDEIVLSEDLEPVTEAMTDSIVPTASADDSEVLIDETEVVLEKTLPIRSKTLEEKSKPQIADLDQQKIVSQKPTIKEKKAESTDAADLIIVDVDIEDEVVSAPKASVENVELDKNQYPKYLEDLYVDTAQLSKTSGRESGVIKGEPIYSTAFVSGNSARVETVALNSTYFVGYVRDYFDKTPLSGVDIRIGDAVQVLHTDSQGRFELMLADKAAKISASLDGYETVEMIIADSAMVALKPDLLAVEEVEFEAQVAPKKQVSRSTSMDETGAVSQFELNEENTYEAPSPEIGMNAYKDYLRSALRYPQEAMENGIEGIVKLKVAFSDKGEIQDIKVKKGLGYGCDQEAIRLVRSGPSWMPATRDEVTIGSSAIVKIRFSK